MAMTTVDWIANTMPWAGSAIPAVMTYQNAQKLGFTWWQAAIIGLVVEGIGFVSITTAVDIYEANVAERETAIDRLGQETQAKRTIADMPFWVAIGGAAVYLMAVLLVNAILDGGDVWQKVALAMLSLFGVIGGLMVALRNQLGKRLANIEHQGQEIQAERAKEDERALERERDERAFAQHLEEEKLKLEHEAAMKKIEETSRRKIEKIRVEALRKVDEQSPDGTGETQTVAGEKAGSIRRWPEVPESDWEWIDQAPAGEIVKKYGIQGKDPERQARAWKKYAREGVEKKKHPEA